MYCNYILYSYSYRQCVYIRILFTSLVYTYTRHHVERTRYRVHIRTVQSYTFSARLPSSLFHSKMGNKGTTTTTKYEIDYTARYYAAPLLYTKKQMYNNNKKKNAVDSSPFVYGPTPTSIASHHMLFCFVLFFKAGGVPI